MVRTINPKRASHLPLEMEGGSLEMAKVLFFGRGGKVQNLNPDFEEVKNQGYENEVSVGFTVRSTNTHFMEYGEVGNKLF